MSGFIAFASLHGLDIDPAKLHRSHRIQRCPTVDHPRSNNGAYFYDGHRGFVWNWEGEAQAQWWNDEGARPWTEADKAEWQAKQRAVRERTRATQAEAAGRAERELLACKQEEHNYLHRKGFKQARGFVDADGALLVPMRNCVTGKLQGAQRISWVVDPATGHGQWVKKMTAGMRAAHAVFPIGPKSSREALLCEGYATGLSIFAALAMARLNARVVVCFSAHNLVQVAQQIGGRKYVMADNDASQTGERVAQQTGLPYAMPEVVGEDWNDVHARAGLFPLVRAIQRLRGSAMT